MINTIDGQCGTKRKKIRYKKEYEIRKFSCIEQYLAVQKAHLADNKNLAREAMGSSNHADHKVVLNKLKAEVADRWAEKAPDIIKSAVKAKFTQNQNLTKFLLDSHPLMIGEASKDTRWGIKLSLEHLEHLEHPDVPDMSKWASGGNLLGKTLVSLREELQFPSELKGKV